MSCIGSGFVVFWRLCIIYILINVLSNIKFFSVMFVILFFFDMSLFSVIIKSGIKFIKVSCMINVIV